MGDQGWTAERIPRLQDELADENDRLLQALDEARHRRITVLRADGDGARRLCLAGRLEAASPRVASMDFQLLGQIRCSDPPVAVAGRQRALLGLLLVHAPEVVSVDRLVEAVWLDEQPRHPVNALHSRVSKLRRLLHDERTLELLVRQGEGYALAVAPEHIDARRFERSADEAHDLLATGEIAEAAERAATALSLWTGDALEPLANEPWARAEAARLEERRLATIEDLAAARLALGQHAPLVAELERQVAAHPLRESLRGQLMLALYRSGRQADALAVYRVGREQLVEELGIDPSPALVELHQHILDQSPQLAPHVRRPLAGSAAPDGAQVAPTPSTGHLVGRTRELSLLMEAADLAVQGRGTTVAVTGEAGIGKSELLHGFVRQVATDGVVTAVGRCAEVAGHPAYWPWSQVLRRVIDQLEPEVLISTLGTAAPDLALLVPEVAERLPELRPAFGGDDPEEPTRLHLAASGFLRRVSERTPVAIVMEDVQYADRASMDLLERIASDLRDHAILLVVSARSPGAAMSGGRTDVLHRLHRLGTLQQLQLTGLDPDAVGALAGARIEHAATPDLVRALHERSAGNPLFVLELLRYLRSRDLDIDPGEALFERLPPALRQVIATRLAALPPTTRSCLEAAAVLGRQIDADTVARMLERPLTEVADDLEAAVQAGVLEHQDETWFGSSRFVHALVRETLEAELPPVRRAQLHAAAGAVVAAQGGEDQAAAVAHHLERSVPLTPPGAAVDAMVAAADHAAAMLAHDEAEATLERALVLLRRHGHDREREIRIWSRVVALATVSDGFTSPRARTAFERIRALSGRIGDAPEVVGTLWAQWAYWANCARTDLARELAEDLLRDGIEDDDAAATAAGAFAVGQTAFLVGEPVRAADHLQRSAQLLEGLPDGEATRRGLDLLAVNGQCALAHPLWLAGHTDAADRSAHRAVDRADLHGTDYAAAHTRMFLGWYHAARGEAEPALAWSTDAVRRGEDGGFSLVVDLGGTFAGWATAATGDPASGINQLWSAMEALRRSGFTMLRSWHLELLAQGLLAAGRDEEARDTAREAIEVAQRSRTTFHLATHQLTLARALDATGERADAERTLATATRIAEAQGSPTLEALIAAGVARP